MAAINDPIGAQLKAIADQQRSQQTQQAVQAAASAAAQINAKLGLNNRPVRVLPNTHNEQFENINVLKYGF